MIYLYAVKIKNSITKVLILIKYTLSYLKRFLDEKLKIWRNKERVLLPKTLQLPITYKCNFDCAMCGMRNLIAQKEFSSEDLQIIIKDPIYRSIKSIGINGGEPFLRSDILEVIEVLLQLPNLQDIYFITNGYFTDKILYNLSIIHEKCEDKQVSVHVSISVDGVEEMQEKMRGNKFAFKNAENTCRKIFDNKNRYCDDINIISTITRINISKIYQVQKWAETMGLEVAYNIATIHERLDNHDKYDDFSIFTDEYARHLAMEFFYSLFYQSKSQRYFAIYYYIKMQKRIAYCDYQNDAITLVPNGNLVYCATHSKELGNVLQSSTTDVYMKNLGYKKHLHENYCDSCSHYMYDLTAEGLKLYYKELMRLI